MKQYNFTTAPPEQVEPCQVRPHNYIGWDQVYRVVSRFPTGEVKKCVETEYHIHNSKPLPEGFERASLSIRYVQQEWITIIPFPES